MGRCMEHAVHVASKHFVGAIGSKSRQAANGGLDGDNNNNNNNDNRTDTSDSL